MSQNSRAPPETPAPPESPRQTSSVKSLGERLFTAVLMGVTSGLLLGALAAFGLDAVCHLFAGGGVSSDLFFWVMGSGLAAVALFLAVKDPSPKLPAGLRKTLLVTEVFLRVVCGLLLLLSLAFVLQFLARIVYAIYALVKALVLDAKPLVHRSRVE